MATRLYMRGTSVLRSSTTTGVVTSNAAWWSGNQTHYDLSPTAGASSVTTGNNATAAGPSHGRAYSINSSAVAIFITDVIPEGVTISGSITINVWTAESSTMANVGAEAQAWVVGVGLLFGAGVLVNTGYSGTGVEMSTSLAARNWTVGSPTSRTVPADGRIAMQVSFGDAGGTQASGFNSTFAYDGPTGGAQGDSWIEFTENFTVGAAASDSPFPYTGGGYYGFRELPERLRRRLWQGWDRHGGVLVPKGSF